MNIYPESQGGDELCIIAESIIIYKKFVKIK